MSLTLTLAVASRIANAALEAGRAENITALSVVVTDAGGHIRVAMRGDGVGNHGVRIALAKATTAVGFNRSSMQLSKTLGTNAAAVAAISELTAGQFLPLGGGVLIHDAAGNVLGAAAVAGSSPENDERFVTQAVRAAGLVVPA